MDNMDMNKKQPLHMVTFCLLIIGGLNWLIFGLFGTDIGTWLGGMDQVLSRVIYILVGLSAVIEIAMHKKLCRMCGMGKNGMNNKPSGM